MDVQSMYINGGLQEHQENYLQLNRTRCVRRRDDGITIKINKRDNLLINDHQKASSTLTSPSKALVLTMLQPSRFS